ncbi:13094_t:CDS:2, partial [Gigaspora margarita]
KKVLKDDKGKVFVLEYSGEKGKRGFQEGKVVGKEKVQKIKNCQKKRRLLEEGKGSLLEEGRVVERKESYQEEYYQRGCNCQK